MFPTKAELEHKKLEQLRPQAELLAEVCVNALFEHGSPVRVGCAKFPQKVRQMVIAEAAGSGWVIHTDCDSKGEEFLVITEAPPEQEPKKFWSL